MPAHPSPDPFRLYEVPELTHLFKVSRTSIYEAIKKRQLVATKLGRRTLFKAADLAAYLDTLPASKGG